jgi:uncharacterized protein YjbI with pentapeptide repeats
MAKATANNAIPIPITSANEYGSKCTGAKKWITIPIAANMAKINGGNANTPGLSPSFMLLRLCTLTRKR